GAWLIGSLIIGPSRQFGEALVLEDRGDCCGAERLALAGQREADVVNREVLFAEADDLFPKSRLLSSRTALARRGGEKVPLGLIAELMDEDPEAPGCVPEPASGLSRGDPVDEERPQGFVFPMSGVRGLQEAAGQS